MIIQARREQHLSALGSLAVVAGAQRHPLTEIEYIGLLATRDEIGVLGVCPGVRLHDGTVEETTFDKQSTELLEAVLRAWADDNDDVFPWQDLVLGIEAGQQGQQARVMTLVHRREDDQQGQPSPIDHERELPEQLSELFELTARVFAAGAPSTASTEKGDQHG